MKISKLNLKNVAVRVAGVGAGAVASNFIGLKFGSSLNPKMLGAGKVVIGGVLPLLMPKQQILNHVGDGFIADGALTLAKSLVPALFASAVSGIEDESESLDGIGSELVSDDSYEQISGEEEMLNGIEDDALSGSEEEEEEEAIYGADDLVF